MTYNVICEGGNIMKNIIDLEIDLGNYNIKTSTGVIFRSTFEYGIPCNPLGEHIISFNGNSYTMEKGTFNNTFNKAKKDYLPNLLYAIIKSSSNHQEDFNLMLGYPLDNSSVAEEFKEALRGNEYEVEYRRGSTIVNRIIRIHDVKCVGEGVSSHYTLNANQRNEDCVLVDIGGRTSNVCVFVKRKLVNKFTIPLGTLDLFESIISRWNNDNGDNKTVEDAERLIDNGYITGTEIEEKQFLDELMNGIEKKLDRKVYQHNYYTGGGSLRLKFLIENYLEPHGEVLDNPLFSNVNGNKEINKALKNGK